MKIKPFRGYPENFYAAPTRPGRLGAQKMHVLPYKYLVELLFFYQNQFNRPFTSMTEHPYKLHEK